MTETQVLEPLRIEVIPAGSDTPILVRERGQTEFRRVPGGSLAPVNPKPTFSKVKGFNQPRTQPKTGTGGRISSNGFRQYRQPQRVPSGGSSPLIDYESEKALADFVIGFTNGVFDEVSDIPREDRENNSYFRINEPLQDAYDFGRVVVNWSEDVVEEVTDRYREHFQDHPDFGLPEIEFPDFQFPDFELPEIEFPPGESEFPDLPEIELPDFQFPDFNPFNESDRERLRTWQDNHQKEVERRQQRERDRTENRTYKESQRLVDQLDEGCVLRLNYTRMRLISIIGYENSNPRYPIYLIGNWQPIKLEREQYGGWEIVEGGIAIEYPEYYYMPPFTEQYTESAGVLLTKWQSFIPETRSIIQVEELRLIIPKTFRQNNLNYSDINSFLYDSARNIYIGDTDGNSYIDNINLFSLSGVLSTCSINILEEPDYIPPKPEEMNCCSCDDIALVIRRTMQSMKFKVNVPFISCELNEDDNEWQPKVNYRDIQVFAPDAATAQAQAEVYRELAYRAKDECESRNLVNKLSKVIGVDDYPVKLPKSLITKTEGFPGNLIPDGEVEVPSLTRLQTWYIERFDEIMGQWEIPIEIKDSDPSTPGNQSVGVKLPNIAEAMAEMFTLVFQSHINTETLLNMQLRNLIESGMDKQQNFVTYKLLQSLTDWVGFKQKDIELKMPLTFTLNKTRYDEILQESEVKVGCVEFDDKFGLEADLMRFRKAASILDSVHFKKINPNGDIKGQILKYLLDTLASVDKVNGSGEDDDNFDKFLEEVENGFSTTPGITDPNEPYGRPFEQRPRIRDLTNYQPPSE